MTTDEQVLSRLDRNFKAIFDNASLGIAITSLDGKFILVNDAYTTIVGYEKEEIYSLTLKDITLPQDLALKLELLDKLVHGHIPSFEIRKRYYHKDGSLVWVRNNVSLIKDDAGNPENIISISQNITNEITLENARQQMLALVENSSDYMGVADKNGQVIYMNAAARLLIGLPADASTSKLNAKDFYTAEHFEQLQQQVLPSLQKTGKWNGTIYLRNFTTGEIIPFAASYNTIFDKATNEVIGRGATLRDLRPEIKAREEQQKLLTLANNSVDLMAILGLDGVNSYINKAGMDMLGFETEEDVRNTPVSQLHAPENFELVQNEVLPGVMSKGRWHGKMLVKHLKTGVVFPVYNHCLRIDDPETGNPIAIGAVMRDMRPEMEAQHALLAEERRFRSVIEQSPAAISLLRGKNLIVESANEAILDLWGKEEAIIGMPLNDALPEINGQGFIELLEGVYDTGRPYYGYDTLAKIQRNGVLKDCYFNFVYAPLREADGHVDSIIVLATEVTEQVKTKKALEESERRFRNLILESDMAIAVYRGENMIIDIANDAMIRLWGKTKEVIGMPLKKAIPELEGQPFFELLTNVYYSGKTYTAAEDRANLMVDGALRSFYFNFSYKALHDGEGNIYAVLNVAVDVTSMVQAREKLSETQQRLHIALESAQMATWKLDPLTQSISFSPRLIDWFGMDPEKENPGKGLQNMDPKDRDNTIERLAEALKPGSGGVYRDEYTVTNPTTGTTRIVQSTGQVLYNEQGLPKIMVGSAQDITLQRLTEKELERQIQERTEALQAANEELQATNEELNLSNNQLYNSNQELERFAFIASHDLQEPLRKIRIYSSLFKNKFAKNIAGEERDYLEKIVGSADRMSRLIEDILDFSRISNERGFTGNIDLNEILTEVLKDLESTFAVSGGNVICEPLPTIDAVPFQMGQLFQNLIGNALKFARKNVPPVVHISSTKLTKKQVSQHPMLDKKKDYCEIIVKDNGIGFDDKFSEQIFVLFQRLHPKHVYEGTGVGLALCQKIVQHHHGLIFASSEEGTGATFHIVLPIRQIDLL